MSKILYLEASGFTYPVIVYKNKAMVKNVIFDLNDEKTIMRLISSEHLLVWDMVDVIKQAQLSNMRCVTEESFTPQHMVNRLVSFVVGYCKEYGRDEKLRQLLLRLNGGSDGLALVSYCAQIDILDTEVKQAILNHEEASLALDYCLFFGPDQAMSEKILDSGNTDYALLYYQQVDEDPRMRQVIADSEHTEVITDYCSIFDYDVDMNELLQRLLQEKA